METIVNVVLILVILFSVTFLLTYFKEIRGEWKYWLAKTRKARRRARQLEYESNITLRIRN